MIRLALKLALAAAAVWAVFSFVPVRGRTLADRWAAAPTFSAFVERGLAEATRDRAPPKGPQARAQRPGARERPTEAHTEHDRRALDRILAEQLSEHR
jgi:hypothetical protein